MRTPVQAPILPIRRFIRGASSLDGLAPGQGLIAIVKSPLGGPAGNSVALVWSVLEARADELLALLDRPNRFMDRYEFWRTVILHRSIAGNAYALKVRSQSGAVVELITIRTERKLVKNVTI